MAFVTGNLTPEENEQAREKTRGASERAKTLAESLEGIATLLHAEAARGEQAEGCTLLGLALDADNKAGEFISWYNDDHN